MNDYTKQKEILETEQKELREELGKLGATTSDNPTDWEVKAPDLQVMSADQNEVADVSEEMQTNAGIIEELETRYKNVSQALERIAQGTYGTCSECGKEIEKGRLEANPAAKTCTKHAGTA